MTLDLQIDSPQTPALDVPESFGLEARVARLGFEEGRVSPRLSPGSTEMQLAVDQEHHGCECLPPPAPSPYHLSLLGIHATWSGEDHQQPAWSP